MTVFKQVPRTLLPPSPTDSPAPNSHHWLYTGKYLYLYLTCNRLSRWNVGKYTFNRTFRFWIDIHVVFFWSSYETTLQVAGIKNNVDILYDKRRFLCKNILLNGNFLDKKSVIFQSIFSKRFVIAPKRTILLQSIRLYNARNKWVRIWSVNVNGTSYFRKDRYSSTMHLEQTAESTKSAVH